MSSTTETVVLDRFGFSAKASPPSFTGYLWKLGRGFVKTWKYRFFVIQDQCVKYYTDDTLTTVKGCFYFNQQSEVKYGPYRHEGRNNILVLQSEHDSGMAHTMYLSAPSIDEQKRWYDAFGAAIVTSFPSVLRTEVWPTKFTPKTALGAVFNGVRGTSEMEDGNMIDVDDMTQQPTMYYNAPAADSNKFYSLLLVSCDDAMKASPKNSSKVSYATSILWLTCNLPHSSLETIIARFEILPFQPPDVVDFTSTHRVFCVLFEQKSELDVQKMKISVSRRDLPVADVIGKMDLVLPVGICGCYVRRTALSICHDIEDSTVDDVGLRKTSSFGPASLQPSSAHSSSSRNSAIMYRIPEDGELDLDRLLVMGSPNRSSTRSNGMSPSSDSDSFSLPSSNKRVSFCSSVSPGLNTASSQSELLSTDSNASGGAQKLISVMKNTKGKPQRKKTVSFRLEEEEHHVLAAKSMPDEVAIDMYDFDDQPDYEMEYYTSQAASNVSKIAAAPIITSKASKDALLSSEDEDANHNHKNHNKGSNGQITSPKSVLSPKSVSTPTTPVEKQKVPLTINVQAEELSAKKTPSPSPKGGSLARGMYTNSFVIHRNKNEQSPKAASIPNNSSVDSFTDLSYMEKVARFNSPEALALYFSVKTTTIFSGSMLKKKFSTDYFFKNSLVFLDAASLTLRWTKSADMKADSPKHKFIAFHATTTAQSRAVGACKGVAQHVMRLDRTLTVYLNSGQTLMLEGDVAIMEDWCKVLTAIIQEK